MSTLASIMNVREALEEGFKPIFIAAGFDAFTRLNITAQFQNITPRVEYKVRIGNATGHRYVNSQGILRNDEWSFDLGIQCVTRPEPDAVNNELDPLYVSTVRGVCEQLGQSTWADFINFPNHLVCQALIETPEHGELTMEDSIEYTTLMYSGIVRVRTGVWPD